MEQNIKIKELDYIERVYELADDCKLDFSGGQIENVYRKAEIYEILKGKSVGFDDILAFCEEETLALQVSKIGFILEYP